MHTVTPNGRHPSPPQPRKQLSDQLDRFDQILDGLSEALNESVAEAVRDGTKLAVMELMSSPVLKNLFQASGTTPAAPPPARPHRSTWEKVKELLRRARLAVAAIVRWTVTSVRAKVRAIRGTVVGAVHVTTTSWRVKLAVLAVAAIGVALGAGTYYFTPHTGAILSGAGGAVVALAVRTAVWVRSALRIVLPT